MQRIFLKKPKNPLGSLLSRQLSSRQFPFKLLFFFNLFLLPIKKANPFFKSGEFAVNILTRYREAAISVLKMFEILAFRHFEI